MKKILALLASLCLVCAFATACKDGNGGDGFFKPNKTPAGQQSSTPDKGDNNSSDDEEDGGWTGFY